MFPAVLGSLFARNPHEYCSETMVPVRTAKRGLDTATCFTNFRRTYENPLSCFSHEGINRSIDQSINRSIDQSVNRSIGQSVNRSIGQSVNRSIADFFSGFNPRTFLSSLGIVLMLTACIPVASAIAQIHEKDRYGTLMEGDQINPTIARPANSGFTFVAWEDHSGNDVDIYAMKIDNINGLPMWEPYDGVPVCTASGDQLNPRAAYDSLGNVIVVWEDYRGGDNARIYAQALDVTDATVVTNWPQNGLAICDLDSHAERPRIVGSIDGAFISWVDWRNSPDPPDEPQRDIFLQFISTVDADYPQGGNYQWAANGTLVHQNAAPDQINVALARDWIWLPSAADQVYRGGVILVYQDKRNNGAASGEPVWNIYANRFDAEGNLKWGDVRLAASDETQSMPQLVVTGQLTGYDATMALVTWQDDRSNPGDPDAWDIMGQVVDREVGTAPPTGGFAICNHDGAQQLPEVALYEDWEYPNDPSSYRARSICIWQDDRSAQTGTDVYYGAVDLVNASLYNASTTDGDVVCALGGNQRQAKVDIVRAEANAYVVWQHNAGTNGDEDIHCQSMDVLSLLTRWTSGAGKPVTEAKFDQANPQVGGAVFAWADARRELWHANVPEDWNIYVQTPAECVGPTDMAWRDMFAEVRQSGDASQMRFATDAENNTFVVWKKSTGTEGEDNIYIQRLDVHGVPRWTNSGIQLNTSPLVDHPAVTISDDIGGAQVVWEQSTAGGPMEIWYAKILADGSFDAGPMLLYGGAGPACTYPQIVYTDRIYSDGTPPYTPQVPVYPAYFGYSVGGDLMYGAWPPAAAGPDTRSITSNLFPGDWLKIEKMVSPPGQHLYLVGVGEDPLGDPFFGAMNGPNTFQGDVFCTAMGPFDDFGGIDIALDELSVGGSRDAVVVMSYGVGRGAELHAWWLNATAGVIATSPGPLIATANPPVVQRVSHPRLAADNSRAAGVYGGMLVSWDWEFDAGASQRHKVQTDKLFCNPLANPPTIDWCPLPPHPVERPIEVTAPYPWALEPEIAKINAPNGLDTLTFITWEGLTETCSPTRSREVVGNWVAYNYFPLPNRGPQWSSEKPLSPGGGYYTQTKPLVQTSDENTVRLYWIDGRGAGDLVMSTRLRGAEGDAIYWLKEVADEQQPVPVTLRLGESYPNPLSLRGGGLSHVAVDVDREQYISLKIHDALGREMAVVYEGMLPTGSHVLRVNASTFTAGTYYYVLRADGILATRGVVLVR
jgi:hypothetical protein